MKTDIETRADIEQLLQQFYTTLLQEREMQHIFLEVAQINLKAHLPLLADFWEQVLLKSNGYQGNVLRKHTNLHQQYPLEASHFQYWLETFENTVNQLFEGANAQKAINRAQSIATIIQSKLPSL